MIYFLFGIFVNALTVAITKPVTPRISLEPRVESEFCLPIIIIILGIFLGLMEEGVKPKGFKPGISALLEGFRHIWYVIALGFVLA